MLCNAMLPKMQVPHRQEDRVKTSAIVLHIHMHAAEAKSKTKLYKILGTSKRSLKGSLARKG